MSMLLMAKAMSVKVGNPLRKLVLLKLADNANDKGECFPSYQHIADQCEITKRCAINHINALIEMKLLRKQKRKNNEQNSSNIYFLTLENHTQGVVNKVQQNDELGSLGSELGSLGSELGSLGSELGSLGSELGSLRGSELGSPITSHYINQSINQSINHNPPLSPKGESADADMVSEATPANKKLSVDYDAIGDVFNQVIDGTPIPKIKVMSEQRKKLVLGIAKLLKKQFGDFSPSTFGEYFKDFIQQANQRRDKFYYGGGSTGWIADFDYILKPKTFIRTFEDAL